MRLFNLNDWNDELQTDCSMKQRVPAAEREWLLHLWIDWNEAEGDHGNPNWFHDWHRMDLQVDDTSMHSDNFRMNTGYGRYGAAYNMVALSSFNDELPCVWVDLSLLPKNPTEAKLQATSTRGESTEPT
jgi:hypothetical protein